MPTLTVYFRDDSNNPLSGVYLLVREMPDIESSWSTLFDGVVSGSSQQVQFTSNYIVSYGRSYKDGYTAFGGSAGKWGTWSMTKYISLKKIPEIVDNRGWVTWDWESGFLVQVPPGRYIFDDGWQWHITNNVVGWCGTPEMPDKCFVSGLSFAGQGIEYLKCQDF